MYLDLETIKKHLNIDSDFVDDDNYLMALSEVAEDAIQRHIMRKFEDLMVEGDLPSGIKHAMLLLIGSLYANRESVTYGSPNVLPHSYDYLLDLYQSYTPYC